MFENLAAKLAQRVLKDYFVVGAEEHNNNTSSQSSSATLGIWSGFVQWHNLSFKVDAFNDKLLGSSSLPIQLVHGHVRSIQVTVPWSKLQAASSWLDFVRRNASRQSASTGSNNNTRSRADIVVVLDGISMLFKVDDTYNDAAIRSSRAKKRQKELWKAARRIAAAASGAPDAAAETTWKDYIKERLRDGLLPALADRVQIHIRDLHIRLEDLESDPSSPYATGIVLESMHIQNDATSPPAAAADGLMRKISHLNHLAMYWNAVEENYPGGPEHAILQQLESPREITAALDRTIARRAMTVGLVEGSNATALAAPPTHTYLLLPLDGTLHVTMAGNARMQRDSNQPAVVIRCTIPDVHVQLRDFQCLQIHRLWHCYKEHKYGLQYRHLRPSVSCLEDPRAYWHYACSVIRYQLKEHRLRWCLGRVGRGLIVRRRYCDLYERKLRAASPDDAAGLRPGDGIVRNLMPLSEMERKELQDMEDGFLGDLSIDDITFYRILVERRIGLTQMVPAPVQRASSWFGRSNSTDNLLSGDDDGDNEVEEREYQRLIAYWEELTEGNTSADELEARSLTVIACVLVVDSGKLALFSPLGSTSNQSELRRLQQTYLVFHYERFGADFSLMKDFKSIALQVTLQDFLATETRSDQLQYNVIRRDMERLDFSPHQATDEHDHKTSAPLLSILFTKNPPSEGDFDKGIQARLHPLRLHLVPDCQWIRRTKHLIKPLPQYKKASKFWNDLSMARINSWASVRLGLFAKATSAADHSNTDLFLDVAFPVIEIGDGEGSEIIFDLGRALLRTKKLASVSDAMMDVIQWDGDDARHAYRAFNRFDEESMARSRDDVSDPSRLRQRNTRSYKISNARSIVGSVKFDESVKLDSLGEYMQQTGAFRDNVNEADAFFYDTYELEYTLAGLALQCDDGRDDIIMPIDMRMTIHKSIIPSDHTLTKLKVRCELEEVAVHVLDAHMLTCAELLRTWKSIVSFPVATTSAAEAVGLRLTSRRPVPSMGDLTIPLIDITSDSSSSVGSEDFFDANETQFTLAETTATQVFAHSGWVAESKGLAYGETKLLDKPSRRRKRSGSVLSDVSSISESSLGQAKASAALSYLSAENLAKLVEEEAEASSADESDDDSFHSVVSLNQLLVIETDLSQDIQDAERLLSDFRFQMSRLRRTTEYADPATAENAKRLTRLEIDRTIAELKTLRAAHRDITAQVAMAESDPTFNTCSSSYRARLSTKRASNLLERRKRTMVNVSSVPSDHNLTRGLKRNLVDFSFALHRASLQFGKKISRAVQKAREDGLVVVGISHLVLVVQKHIGETKFLGSVDSIDGRYRSDSRDLDEMTFIIGGCNDPMISNTLPSRYPQFFPAVTVDEKLLRFVMECRRGPSEKGRHAKSTKVRVSFGDVEVIPHELAMHALSQAITCLMTCISANAKRDDMPLTVTHTSIAAVARATFHKDISVRLSAFRVHMLDGFLVGTLAFSELGFRLASTASHEMLKQRSQLDLTCGNVQLVYIDDVSPEKCIELFGRQEVFGTIAGLRMRRQLVPSAMLGGWVLGEDTASGCQINDDDTACQNVYVGIQFQSFLFTLDPGLSCVLAGARRLNLLISEMKGSFTRSKRESQVVRKEVGHAVRWRADVSVQKSSAIVWTKPSKQDHETFPIVQNVVVSLAAQATLQPKMGDSRRTIARIQLAEVSLLQLPSEWEAVKPFTALVLLDSSLGSRGGSEDVQMALPTNSPWMDSKEWSTLASVIRQGGSGVSLCCEIPCLQVNATPSTVDQLGMAFAAIKDVRERSRGTKLPANDIAATRHHDKSNDRKIVFLSGRTSLALFHKGQLPGAMFDQHKIFSLDADNLRFSMTRTAMLRSLSMGLARLVIFDMSCRSGIQTISGGLLSPSAAVGDGPYTPGSDLLVATIAKKVTGHERADIDMDVIFGDIHCIPLPSCVQSLMAFIRSYKALSRNNNERSSKTGENKIGEIHRKVRQIRRILCSLRTGIIQLVLPSKDIIQCIREQHEAHINAVIFRLKLEANCSLNVSILDEIAPVENLFARTDDRMAVEEALMRFISKRVIGQSTAISSELEIKIHDFQALRTMLEQRCDKPYKFDVARGNEQRITNLICFTLNHHLSGTIFPLIEDDGRHCTVSLVHAVQLTANLVDVLVYITQSSGGMNDSIRVTVMPIIHAVKGQRGVGRDTQGGSPTHPTFGDVLRATPVILSLRIDGVRVTCVPGGASRMTEAPIIKFSLRHVCGGVAAATAIVASGPANALASALSAPLASNRHNLAGGWLQVQLAASYHNRRLVAWEPFIEPWGADLVLGVDFTRVLGLPLVANNFSNASNDVDVQIAQHYIAQRHELGNERIRGISRLLRSPFQPDAAVRDSDTHLPWILSHDVDLCYLSLASCAAETIQLAMFPLPTSSNSPPFSLLPGDRTIKWLNRFGYPVEMEQHQNDSTSLPAIVCHLSDSATLNVNVSGALIENLSGYLSDSGGGDLRTMAPHWIRNETGLSLRFMEVLDLERQHESETAPKVTVLNDSQAPISLKRSLSQSCDPHKAYITLELGSFEDTIDRVSPNTTNVPKRSLTDVYSYRVPFKVPLDTVGLHRFPLEWNIEQRQKSASAGKTTDTSLGWVIVRVALHGGVKLVTIESPLLLKNDSDSDLLCEVRDHDGLSVVWRSLIRKHSPVCHGNLSVPVDLVSFLHSDSYLFSAIALPRSSKFKDESELIEADRTQFTPLILPRPFSPSSLSKGVIGVNNKKFRVFGFAPATEALKSIHLNLCSVRIGSFDLDQSLKGSSPTLTVTSIPESRMLLFRSTVAFFNHLAVPVRVQAKPSESVIIQRHVADNSEEVMSNSWIDIGTLESGRGVKWSGVSASSSIELRIQLMPGSGKPSQFLDWSTSTHVPMEDMVPGRPLSNGSVKTILDDLQLHDNAGLPLFVSASLIQGVHVPRLKPNQCVKAISESLPTAGRVIDLFVPFWVIDTTCLDLQFLSEFYLAGQVDSTSIADSKQGQDYELRNESARTSGLGQLLEDGRPAYLPSRVDQPFEVLMIGTEGSGRLQVRRQAPDYMEMRSPWSDSIPLSLDGGDYHDTTVIPSVRTNNSRFSENEVDRSASLPFAVRSRFLSAPDDFGGGFGTKLIHIVSRYEVVNNTGRELEIMSAAGHSSRIVIDADGRHRPFHFDDSRPICFRPREFGWSWSGRFKIKPEKREVTLRLKHELKAEYLTMVIEICSRKGDTCTVEFRYAQPPYRIENHTIYPMAFHQTSSFEIEGLHFRSRANDTVILPYHHASFAWDEPEYGIRSVTVKLVDLSDRKSGRNNGTLGAFKLDCIAPGNDLSMALLDYTGKLDMDGAVRVLRISERTLSLTTSNEGNTSNEEVKVSQQDRIISVKLSHGIGLSIVDWSPQELIYMRLEDIVLDLNQAGSRDNGSISIGCITVDNELWVTPFPVMLRMGSRLARRKNRRHCAVSLSWARRQSVIDLFERVDIAFEPLMVNLDGNLLTFIIELVKTANDVRTSHDSSGPGNSTLKHRDTELRKLMGLRFIDNVAAAKLTTITDDLYCAIDHMATCAIANKLRSKYRPPNQVGQYNAQKARSTTTTETTHRKFYIERLRISAITAKISWTGFLPVASSFPRLLRPALTFENLPLFLRPFSNGHIYGTIDEHITTVKAHYINIWRIIDLCVGVATKPTFLIRACAFTSRGVLARSLELLSQSLRLSSTRLNEITLTRSPLSALPLRGRIYWSLIRPVVRKTASIVHKLSRAAWDGSTRLHYKATQNRATGQLVRSRNPRLFATIDGQQDLLVEYVEGANSGRALLSRICAGSYLGEGYAYHIEGVRVQSAGARKIDDTDASLLLSVILMVTNERMLLLNGELVANFGEVIWETHFDNLVFVESSEVTTTHSLVQLWYMFNELYSMREGTATLVPRTGGLCTLQSVGVFVPPVACQKLLATMRLAKERLPHLII